MTYRLVTAADALADLENIQRYIARDNPGRARSFVDELRGHARAVADHPLAYRLRPEFGDEIRAVAFRGYLLFYRVAGADVRLPRVIHGARDLRDLSFD